MEKYEHIFDMVYYIVKNPIILRDDKNYAKIRSYEKELQDFFQEYFAYELHIDYEMTRLFRIPNIPKEIMGIRAFNKTEEFTIFMLLIDYLEELQKGNSILISDLVSYITDFYPQEVDWRNYRINQSLIKVLKYAQKIELIRKLDGSEDDFLKYGEENIEVLYENTGVSKELMINIPIINDNLNKLEDFLVIQENSRLTGIKKARRELLNRTVIYKDEELYDIVKENKNQLDDEFERIFYGDLIVTEEFAYLLMGEEKNIANAFPDNRNVTLIALLFCNQLLKKDKLVFTKDEFDADLELVLNKYKNSMSKENQKKKQEEFGEEIRELLYSFEVIRETKENKIYFGEILYHFEINEGALEGGENE